MLPALGVSLPLILAVVLIASGIAKLRKPDDLAGWRELGVPRPLQQTWVLRLHPWGEIVLGAALALLGGVLGLLAAVVALLLMVAYTVLIVRTLRKTPDASCACFGETAPVTAWTVVRNAWLTLLALGVVAVIGANPLWGGAIAAAAGSALWVVALAVAMVTVWLIVRRDEPAAQAPASSVAASAPGEDELDYIRVRTPAVPVTLADGTVVSLRKLAERRPVLLLAVQELCGACEPVIDAIGRYRELLPEVDVRFLLIDTPDASRLTSTVEPQSVHDPERYVGDSLIDRLSTPTAILLGADGMLAGGPEVGSVAIDAFVDDIYESLHGERPSR